MSARVWQIMIKKLKEEQKVLESRLGERKRRALELRSKIQNLESYLRDYLTPDSRDMEFDRKKLLLRESTMAFASQLNAAKLKLEEGLDTCNSECEALRKDLLSLLIESSKYQKMEEAYFRRQRSLTEKADRKYPDELSTLSYLRSNTGVF